MSPSENKVIIIIIIIKIHCTTYVTQRTPPTNSASTYSVKAQ